MAARGLALLGRRLAPRVLKIVGKTAGSAIAGTAVDRVANNVIDYDSDYILDDGGEQGEEVVIELDEDELSEEEDYLYHFSHHQQLNGWEVNW